MTAMMTLCLVVMAVTIVAISRKLEEKISDEVSRARDISKVCNDLQASVGAERGIHVNCRDNRIDFGEAGYFGDNDYKLHPDAERYLAELVPAVLSAAESDLGKRWLKQVVIEGYTDTRGSYLYNLYLSLQRSYWLMCTLVDPKMNASLKLTDAQKQLIREIFLAGGVSFNDAKESLRASRRVELRLQFLSLEEQKSGMSAVRPSIQSTNQDVCSLK
jgi:outer membrane protein OmpA-like peptidoglycan-associated protein